MERGNASVRAGPPRRASKETARQEDAPSVAVHIDLAVREKAAGDAHMWLNKTDPEKETDRKKAGKFLKREQKSEDRARGHIRGNG